MLSVFIGQVTQQLWLWRQRILSVQLQSNCRMFINSIINRSITIQTWILCRVQKKSYGKIIGRIIKTKGNIMLDFPVYHKAGQYGLPWIMVFWSQIFSPSIGHFLKLDAGWPLSLCFHHSPISGRKLVPWEHLIHIGSLCYFSCERC